MANVASSYTRSKSLHLRPAVKVLIPCRSLSTGRVRSNTLGPPRVSTEGGRGRKAGDDVTRRQTLTDVVDHDIVSHDGICATSAKKVAKHEATAISELSLMLEEQQDKLSTPLRKRHPPYEAPGEIPGNRPGSPKTGKPDFCSMGGVGRSQDTHRVKSMNTSAPQCFKLPHQKMMSQSLAANMKPYATKFNSVARDQPPELTEEYLSSIRR